MLSRFLVLAMRVFILTFGLRYVGFSPEQSIILTLCIVSAMHIQ